MQSHIVCRPQCVQLARWFFRGESDKNNNAVSGYCKAINSVRVISRQISDRKSERKGGHEKRPQLSRGESRSIFSANCFCTRAQKLPSSRDPAFLFSRVACAEKQLLQLKVSVSDK